MAHFMWPVYKPHITGIGTSVSKTDTVLVTDLILAYLGHLFGLELH